MVGAIVCAIAAIAMVVVGIVVGAIVCAIAAIAMVVIRVVAIALRARRGVRVGRGSGQQANLARHQAIRGQSRLDLHDCV